MHDARAETSPIDPPQYPCPSCAAPVAPPADGSPILQCPQCGTQFFLPESNDPDDAVLDYAPPGSPIPTPDIATHDLDALRIRHISTLRRGAYRNRSYGIITAGVLIVGAIELVLMAIDFVRHIGWRARPISYLCFAAAALLGAGFFAYRIIELTQEIRRSALQEPETPPDFSTLSDGSQQVQALEQMQMEQEVRQEDQIG